MTSIQIEPRCAQGTEDPQGAAEQRLTYGQLHELACVVCRRDDVELFPAGHRTQDGLTWAVVACAEHRQAER
jgi:hypothetical protein